MKALLLRRLAGRGRRIQPAAAITLGESTPIPSPGCIHPCPAIFRHVAYLATLVTATCKFCLAQDHGDRACVRAASGCTRRGRHCICRLLWRCLPLGSPMLLFAFAAVVFTECVGVAASPVVPDLLDAANTFGT